MGYYRKGGRYAKKSEINWRLLGIVLAIVLLFAFCIANSIRNSKYLSNTNQFTVEAGTPLDDCEYDYHNANLGFVGKLCIPLFYKVSDDVNNTKPGTYSVTYDSRLPFMSDHTHTVTIVDTTPPDLFIEPLKSSVFQSLYEFVDPGYYAVDICDGEVEVQTEYLHTRPCFYTIRYSATDKSGNTSERFREINVVQGQVALTFDDGPSLNITPQVLDILADNNVKATFFILGYGSEKKDLVLREFTDGHTIGYHGTSHQYSYVYSSLDTLINNFTSLEEDVLELTGYSSKLIRFPGGSSNTVSIKYCPGIMSTAVKEVTDAGYTYFDWNVDSDDAGSARSADDVYQNVVSGIRPGRLNVVLMHDSANKQYTLSALQRIIDFCLENDYELVSLSSESTQITHKIAN